MCIYLPNWRNRLQISTKYCCFSWTRHFKNFEVFWKNISLNHLAGECWQLSTGHHKPLPDTLAQRRIMGKEGKETPAAWIHSSACVRSWGTLCSEIQTTWALALTLFVHSFRGVEKLTLYTGSGSPIQIVMTYVNATQERFLLFLYIFTFFVQTVRILLLTESSDFFSSFLDWLCPLFHT